MEWQEFDGSEKHVTWDDLIEYVEKYPSSIVLFEKLTEYLRWKRFDKIDTALINKDNYEQTFSYCKALEFVNGRLKKLIERGKKKQNDGT